MTPDVGRAARHSAYRLAAAKANMNLNSGIRWREATRVERSWVLGALVLLDELTCGCLLASTASVPAVDQVQ